VHHKFTPKDVARFWGTVRLDDGCWEWMGKIRRPRGYGVFFHSPGRHERFAHRVAWEITNGPIPDGVFVCHKCDNPRCVRPSHLFLGNHRDNMLDARIKERFWKTKLTAGDIGTIRARRARGETNVEIARDFGVSPVTISHAVNRNTWKHVV